MDLRYFMFLLVQKRFHELRIRRRRNQCRNLPLDPRHRTSNIRELFSLSLIEKLNHILIRRRRKRNIQTSCINLRQSSLHLRYSIFLQLVNRVDHEIRGRRRRWRSCAHILFHRIYRRSHIMYFLSLLLVHQLHHLVIRSRWQFMSASFSSMLDIRYCIANIREFCFLLFKETLECFLIRRRRR